MTVYTPTDLRVIFIPGGCGTPHERAATGTQWRLDCPACEQAGAKQLAVLGCASHPGGVRLTCDEMAQAEHDEKEAQRAGWRNLAGQVANAASLGSHVPAEVMAALEALQAQNAALAEQVAALQAAQRQPAPAPEPVHVPEPGPVAEVAEPAPVKAAPVRKAGPRKAQPEA